MRKAMLIGGTVAFVAAAGVGITKEVNKYADRNAQVTLAEVRYHTFKEGDKGKYFCLYQPQPFPSSGPERGFVLGRQGGEAGEILVSVPYTFKHMIDGSWRSYSIKRLKHPKKGISIGGYDTPEIKISLDTILREGKPFDRVLYFPSIPKTCPDYKEVMKRGR